MFSILALKDEIYKFQQRKGYGRLVDPEHLEYVLTPLKERLEHMQLQINSGKYDDASYNNLLKAQKAREELIVEKAKKDHDKTRAQSRADMIQKEINGQNEIDIPKDVKQANKDVKTLLKVDSLSTKEINQSITEYIEFSKNFNSVDKMWCISALEDEIQKFKIREGYGNLVDPDHTE